MIWYIANSGTRSLVDGLMFLLAHYFNKELDVELNSLNREFLYNKLQAVRSHNEVDFSEIVWIPFYLAILKIKEISNKWKELGRPLTWIKDTITKGIFFHSHEELIKFNNIPSGSFALRTCWGTRRQQNKRVYELEEPLCITIWQNGITEPYKTNLQDILECKFLSIKELSYMVVSDGKITVIDVESIKQFGNFSSTESDGNRKKELSSLTPIFFGQT